MSKGLERILTLTFGTGGNDANHLGMGWSGDEPGRRWMLGQASELWLEHPGTGADFILELDAEVIVAPPALLAQRMVVGVRRQGIAQVAVSRPGVLGFHIPAALLTDPGPVRLLFVHPDFRRPKDSGNGTDDRELSFSLSGLRLSRVVPGPPSLAAIVPPPAELMLRFESLGDNCEFGLAQRGHGIEPLGLLRFAYIEFVLLMKALGNGFAGLGEPETTQIQIEGPEEEFIVRDKVFGITYHTFQTTSQSDIETVRTQQRARLNFLKRKLLDDLTEGGKIFVVKRNDPLRPEEVLPLYAAINDARRNWLLWVVPADGANPAGKVEVLLPGLLRGYLAHFAPYDNAPSVDVPAWTALCEAAWRLAGGGLGS